MKNYIGKISFLFLLNSCSNDSQHSKLEKYYMDKSGAKDVQLKMEISDSGNEKKDTIITLEIDNPSKLDFNDSTRVNFVAMNLADDLFERDTAQKYKTLKIIFKKRDWWFLIPYDTKISSLFKR